MKIIISGVTGLIGGEILHQCIQNPTITSVVTLSRRALPEELSSNPKVTSLILKDFTKYSDDILAQLAGAEACIWCLGTTNTNLHSRDIDVGYTQAAASAFETHLAPPLVRQGKKFRFLFTSGVFAEKDQDRSLWFIGDARRSRGAGELVVLEHGKAHPDTFEAYTMRPGVVLSKESKLTSLSSIISTHVIVVDDLAAAAIGIVANPGPGGVIHNRELIARGRAARADRADQD